MKVLHPENALEEKTDVQRFDGFLKLTAATPIERVFSMIETYYQRSFVLLMFCNLKRLPGCFNYNTRWPQKDTDLVWIAPRNALSLFVLVSSSMTEKMENYREASIKICWVSYRFGQAWVEKLIGIFRSFGLSILKKLLKSDIVRIKLHEFNLPNLRNISATY